MRSVIFCDFTELGQPSQEEGVSGSLNSCCRPFTVRTPVSPGGFLCLDVGPINKEVQTRVTKVQINWVLLPYSSEET